MIGTSARRGRDYHTESPYKVLEFICQDVPLEEQPLACVSAITTHHRGGESNGVPAYHCRYGLLRFMIELLLRVPSSYAPFGVGGILPNEKK